MVVAPAPVLLAVCAMKVRVVHVTVIGFDDPGVVVRKLGVRPDVVVVIVRIVGPVLDVGGTTG